MLNNLVLPICPKCNDTKFVVTLPNDSGQKLQEHNFDYETHECTKCKITWNFRWSDDVLKKKFGPVA